MSTLRDIATAAYRESGITTVGEALDADMAEEALDRLTVIISSIIGTELGEKLTQVTYGQVGNSYSKALDVASEFNSAYIPANHSVTVNLTAAKTLYLDPAPRDGARIQVIDNGASLGTYNLTLNGNGRKIEAANTVVLSTNSLVREWFYRSDTGNWVRVNDLTLDDDSPFPTKYEDFLVLSLALRLNPRYGISLPNESIAAMKRALKQFRAQYSQHQDVPLELALTRLSGNRQDALGHNEFDLGR